MLALESIGLQTFKGVTGTLDKLGKLTLVTGDNGVGKTAYVAGAQYGAEGRSIVGARPEDCGLLGENGACGVRIALSDGFTWTRRIERPKAKSKTVIHIVGQESLAIKEAAAKIAEHCGTYAPMFSVDAFTQQSADKQRDDVLDLCARARKGDVDAQRLMLMIRLSVLRQHHEIGASAVEIASSQAFQKAPKDLDATQAGQLAASLEARLSESFLKQSTAIYADLLSEIEGDLTVAIGAALAKAKEIKNASKTAKEEGEAASRKLADRKAEFEVVADSFETLTEQRDAKLELHSNAGEQLAVQTSTETTRTTLKTAAETLAADVLKLTSELKTARVIPEGETVEHAVALETQASAIEAQLTLAITPRQVTAAWTIVQGADAAWQDANKKSRDAENASLTAASALVIANTALEALKESEWSKAYRMWSAVDDEFGHSKDAMSFLARSETWVSLGALIEANSDIRKQHHAEVQIERLAIANDQTTLDASTTKQTADGLREVLETASRAHSKLTADQAVEQKRMKPKRDEVDRFRQEARNVRADCKRRVTTIADAEKRLDGATSDRAERELALSKLDQAVGEPADKLKQTKEQLQTEIDTLNEQIDAKGRFQQVDAELAGCIADADTMRARYDVADLAVKAIKGLRDELVSTLILPLLERMDRFLTAAGTGRKAYCDLVTPSGTPKFELGWVADIRKVALPALSGGETALFCAALIYALVDLADPPLRLMLMEAGAMDRKHLLQLLNGIEGCQDGFANAIVTTHQKPDGVPEAWDCRHMTRKVANVT